MSTEVSKLLETYEKADKIVCLMCSDPDSLGAAIVCQYLMNNKKRNDKEFTLGSSLNLVKERRDQVDINLDLREALQK